MKRILITGSREWTKWDVVWMALSNEMADAPDGVMIVHGGAQGADTDAAEFAVEYADQYNVAVEEHKADWSRFGKPAGYIRNQEMVDAGADVCLAFPHASPAKRRGTNDCMYRADCAGIPVKVYYGSWMSYHDWKNSDL